MLGLPGPGPPPGGRGVGAGAARGGVRRGGGAGAGGPAGVGGVGGGAAGGAVGRGVGRGVGGARANGGSSPTIALGWMLRSWFLLPAPSIRRGRKGHGAPEACPARSDGPPAERFQSADGARWPPHARRTAEPVDRKRTRK